MISVLAALTGACGSVRNSPADAGGDNVDGPPVDSGNSRGWSSELRIGHDDQANEVSNFGTSIAIDTAGDAMVVFYDQGEVWARRYVRSMDSWDPLKQISDGASSGVNPRVGIDDVGNAIVTWYASSAQGIVYARRFDAATGWATGWGSIATVSGGTAGIQQYMTSLAVTSEGRAAVAMYRWNTGQSTYEVWASVYDPGGSWTAPARMSTAGGTGQLPSIGLARMGNDLRVVTAWYESAGGRLNLVGSVSTYNLASKVLTAGTPTPLENDDTVDHLSPQVMMDDAGNALVLFQQRAANASTYHVLSNRYAAGSWSGAMGVDTAATDARDFRGDMNAGGTAVATWRNCNAGTCSIWARRFVSGNWVPGGKVSDDESSVGSPSVAVDSSGRGLLVWNENAAATRSVFAAELDPQTGWSTGHLLERDDANARENPVVELGKNGTGVAAWVYEVENGTNLRRKIQGAIYRN